MREAQRNKEHRIGQHALLPASSACLPIRGSDHARLATGTKHPFDQVIEKDHSETWQDHPGTGRIVKSLPVGALGEYGNSPHTLTSMPRASRCILPGRIYHLTQRCHDRPFLLRFAKDRDGYRERLREAALNVDASLLTYNITSNQRGVWGGFGARKEGHEPRLRHFSFARSC
jgi:hypothetical protein